MEEELRDLLSKLNTQVDGVEAYLRQLKEIGERPGMKETGFKIGIMLRTYPEIDLGFTLPCLRDRLQDIEDEIDFTLWGEPKK